MNLLQKICLFWLTLFVSAGALAAAPAVAFYYGAQPPWSELQAFDLVVVDPDHVPQPTDLALPHTRPAAYVAVGEVQPTRAYAAAIPAAWLVGDNSDWGSRLVDQSQAQWPQFFTSQVIAPLWARGFRTFFLDTLDSYQRFAKTPAQRAAQEAGMVAVIRALKQRYPDIGLIFNRGFEILPQVHQDVEMVVAESLFRGYNAGKRIYTEVAEADRQWLLGKLQGVRDNYHLPVVAIDYVAAAERTLARQTAQQIMDLGLIPWVATPELASLGVGAIEVMPRKVLVVHSALPDEYALRYNDALRLGSMPLNYLGYVPEFVDVNHLPDLTLAGRYAGAVLWLTAALPYDQKNRLNRWLEAQTQDKLPLALINPPEELLTGAMAKLWGITPAATPTPAAPVQINQQSGMMGFEIAPRPERRDIVPMTIAQGQALLTLRQGPAQQVAAAITPWGGYVMENFSVIALPGNAGDRWVIDPFAFFQSALRLPALPVPDVTTESGRRMLMVHMDGDGFISTSELPGKPLAGAVVLQQVAKKYPLPMTLSVIEAELSPQGRYPELSAQAEAIARELFRLPNVAPASHSYSHPFVWRKAVGANADGGYTLPIAGYQFDLQREIDGSVRYLQDRLMPPGKRVDMFFWTGDCVPGDDALALSRKLGLLNLNGGDTVATRSNPSLTQVEGMGIPRAGGFQVFAPNQNENVYTNNWLGPFYGYQRVIETFELTEKPRRLKPIDIYFHTYLTTKVTGLESLDKVFTYALAQQTTPVFVADYARKVNNFQTLAVAKTSTGWRIRGATALRTLRLPAGALRPNVAASQGVAGYNDAAATYVHLSADAAELTLGAQTGERARLVSANARIERFEARPGVSRWHLAGNVPLAFTLANVQGCQVRVDGRDLKPVRRHGHFSEFQIKDHVARALEAVCQP